MNQPQTTSHGAASANDHHYTAPAGPPGTKENTVKDFRFLSRHERLALAAVAAVAALAVGSAVLLPFAVDGSAPYFGSDAASLAVVERCRVLPPRAERHACLRAVAAAGDAVAPKPVAQLSR